MFKKSLLSATFLALALTFSAVTTAHAQTPDSPIYFAGYLGVNLGGDRGFSESRSNSDGDIKFKPVPSFAGALGVRLSDNFRIEAELGFSKNYIDNIKTGGAAFNMPGYLNSYQGLLNLYYDLDVPWKIKPYLGAGIGMGWHKSHFGANALAPSSSDSGVNMIWQLGAGMKYRVNSEFAFTGGYRYMDGTDIKLGPYKVDAGNHEFRVGLEWSLPVQ